MPKLYIDGEQYDISSTQVVIEPDGKFIIGDDEIEITDLDDHEVHLKILPGSHGGVAISTVPK